MSERIITGDRTRMGRLAIPITATIEDGAMVSAEVLVRPGGGLAWPLHTTIASTGLHVHVWRVLVEPFERDLLLDIWAPWPVRRETANVTAWQVLAKSDGRQPPQVQLELLSRVPRAALDAVLWNRLDRVNGWEDAPIAYQRLAARQTGAVAAQR